MDEYRSNIELAGVVEKILEANSVGITTHAKPDGDAFGSVVALATVLRAIGKDVTSWFMPPVPTNLSDLEGHGLVKPYNPSVQLGQPDLFIVADTGAWSQISPMKKAISDILDRTMVIDHHIAGDLPAPWRYIDSKAAACCEIIAQLIDKLSDAVDGNGDYFTPVVCEVLFVGIASDTGWFRFSNTRPETHELAARLIRLGVDHADVYRRVEQRARPEKLALQTRALDSLKLVADSRVAVIVLTAKDFDQTGAMLEETERFVDMPQSVATVQVVVLITETPVHHKHAQLAETSVEGHDSSSGGGTIRVSFRSKPGPRAVNVAELAQQFGGGGHARAAGAKIRRPLDEVINNITKAAVAAVIANDA